MAYGRAGRSGLSLPRLSLGLWQNFGTERSWEMQRDIARRAFDLGVTHFDLANNYGPPAGSAESNFGHQLAGDFKPFRDELVISSKAGFDMWPGPYGDGGSRKYLLSSLDQSLARLQLDYVDIFYSHRYDETVPLEETMGALATAVAQGKALYVGISNYGPQQTLEAQSILADLGVPLLVHQPRYSMLDREPENGLLDTIEKLAVGCIVYSPLAQGLLTDRYLKGDVPSSSRAAVEGSLSSGAIDQNYLNFARGLRSIASDRGQSVAQLALSWVLRDDRVSSAIIGASSVEQLNQNIAALEASPLTTVELDNIEILLTEWSSK